MLHITVSLHCGGASSENQTYLVRKEELSASSRKKDKADEDSLATSCHYTICKAAPSIGRIRFDFNARHFI